MAPAAGGDPVSLASNARGLRVHLRTAEDVTQPHPSVPQDVTGDYPTTDPDDPIEAVGTSLLKASTWALRSTTGCSRGRRLSVWVPT